MTLLLAFKTNNLSANRCRINQNLSGKVEDADHQFRYEFPQGSRPEEIGILTGPQVPSKMNRSIGFQIEWTAPSSLYSPEKKVDHLFRAGDGGLSLGEHHAGESLMLEGAQNEMHVIADFEILSEMAALLSGFHSRSYQIPEPPGVPIFLRFVEFGIPVQFQYENTSLPFSNLKIQSPPS